MTAWRTVFTFVLPLYSIYTDLELHFGVQIQQVCPNYCPGPSRIFERGGAGHCWEARIDLLEIPKVGEWTRWIIRACSVWLSVELFAHCHKQTTIQEDAQKKWMLKRAFKLFQDVDLSFLHQNTSWAVFNQTTSSIFRPWLSSANQLLLFLSWVCAILEVHFPISRNFYRRIGPLETEFSTSYPALVSIRILMSRPMIPTPYIFPTEPIAEGRNPLLDFAYHPFSIIPNVSWRLIHGRVSR